MYAQYYRQQRTSGRVSKLIRQSHRWLAILFTLAVAANFAVRAFAQPPLWLVYAPLAPLLLMSLSGLYLFALPCLAKARRP
jgi:hypothetical protein